MNKDQHPNPEDQNEEDKTEKFFDDENYSTLIVNDKEFKSVKKAKLEDLVELLTAEDRVKKDAALQLLKDEKAKNFLLDAIHHIDNDEHQSVLVAACWESGLDFSEHLEAFVELAIEGDYFTTLEASTVIENMEGAIEEGVLDKAIKALQGAIELKNDKMILLSDLKINLLERKAQLKN
ncbi:MAG: hypothetical protein ACJ76F_01535 [Bacteroidia bacterium]